VNPEIILLNAVGRPLLVDFNLAEDINDVAGRQGMIRATLAYISPEHLEAFECSQTSAVPVGSAADVCSLALVTSKCLLAVSLCERLNPAYKWRGAELP
jgi:serine/threonine protein kinase